MAGRHRKRPPVWRRLLLASLAGAAIALGVTVMHTPGVVPQDAGAPAPAFPPVAMSIKLPTIAVPTLPPPTTTPAPTTTPPPPPPPSPKPAPQSCGATGWGVHPNVARVGHHLAQVFGLKVAGILGLGGRATAGSDHPKGLALDLMVYANRTLGDQIAAYVLAHRKEFGVTYVIWRQRINQGAGWVAMEDRGSITANHYDHVHVSFSASAAVSVTC